MSNCTKANVLAEDDDDDDDTRIVTDTILPNRSKRVRISISLQSLRVGGGDGSGRSWGGEGRVEERVEAVNEGE